MYEMTAEERAEREKTKALHQKVRADLKKDIGTWNDRTMFLVWGFIRGFKYRRIERSHRLQELSWSSEAKAFVGAAIAYKKIDGKWFYEHNLPDVYLLTKALAKYKPEVTIAEVTAWLADPSGAIPAPPPRPKKSISKWVQTTCSECQEPVYAREEDVPVVHAGCALRGVPKESEKELIHGGGEEVTVTLPAAATK